MSETIFEEIHGFVSPGEYKRFLDYLDRQIKANVIKEVFPECEAAEIRANQCRCFNELDTGYVWKLTIPDPPFYGLWERVVSNKKDEP